MVFYDHYAEEVVNMNHVDKANDQSEDIKQYQI